MFDIDINPASVELLIDEQKKQTNSNFHKELPLHSINENEE